ncbi:hypothetical protein ACGYLL_07415, partial [Sulfitobacter sp. M23905]
IAALATPQPCPWSDALPWRFDAAGAQAVLFTSPEALPFLQDIAHLSPTPRGMTASGFAQIAIRL